MSQRSPFNKRNTPTMSDEKSTSAGMARKGSSSAKPARAAAGSVRQVSVKRDRDGFTTTKNMTKEEKKALRKKEREEDDIIADLTNLVTKNNPIYAHYRRIWWVLMIIGFACVGISFVGSYVGTSVGEGQYNISTTRGIISIVALVLAYVFIIGALVWEFIKLRPIRNQTNEEIRSMSDKRRARVLEQCYEAEAERKANRKFFPKAKPESTEEDEAE